MQPTRPCPFCASTAAIRSTRRTRWVETVTHCVVCTRCGAQGSGIVQALCAHLHGGVIMENALTIRCSKGG